MNHDKTSVIIIGAGIGGLSTGVYAQMNGLDSQIFEMHVLPGGCCTSWSRKGYIFDYCIEWLIGSGTGNDANRIWRELGALDGKTVTNFELFNRIVDENGRSVTFYNDPDRLERHLAKVSPDDVALTKAFCDDLRRFAKLDLYPFLKPWALMTGFEKIKMIRGVLPAFRLFWRNAATQMKDFCAKIKDPLLRRAFPNIFFQDHECFPLLPYLYNIACAFKNNAGFPQGGSLGLSKSIEKRYRSLGGVIRYRSKVAKILVENDRAVGIQLRDGTRHYADIVVSACDGLTTIYGMLDGNYVNKTIEKLYQDMLQRPGILYPGVVSAFVGVKGDFDRDEVHSTTYLLSDEDAAALPAASQRSLVIQLRSRYSSGFAPPGKSVLHCTYFSDFNYWKKLRTEDRPTYSAEKQKVAAFIHSYLERLYPSIRERIEIVDVASPATTERYTGNFNGSILAWKSFTNAEDLVNTLINKQRMQLPGLQGFYMAGQWIAMGGLIRAASSGRFVVQFICRDLDKKFRAWESQEDIAWKNERLGYLPRLDDKPELQSITE
jgi:phytoene dehydrogenase-like protein